MSIDLNLTGNRWQELKVQINRQPPKNLQVLERVTIEQRKKIPEKTFSNLIKTLEKDCSNLRGHAIEN